MTALISNDAAFADALEAVVGARQDVDLKQELEYLRGLLDGPHESSFRQELHLDDYANALPSGAGGSGLIIRLDHRPTGTQRALKVPLRRIYQGSPDPGEILPVDPEVEALARVSHQNITRLFATAKLAAGTGFGIVTEFVDAPSDLAEYAVNAVKHGFGERADVEREQQFRHLAELIYQLARAIQYMHEDVGLLHFDIKPDNLLISAKGQPYVTDLGFARDMRTPASVATVDVGFTARYAHPTIGLPDRGLRITTNQAKSRNTLPVGALSPVFDLFAFGRTIQELLHRLVAEHGDRVYSDYVFNYLHVLACLCLDRHNSADEPRHDSNFVSDAALGAHPRIFKEHAFRSFSDVSASLERLLGVRRLEDDLPELDPWLGAIINASDNGSTAFTPRVRAVVSHPATQRLRGELQLGQLETVFPTSTHTRFQHSLGVFHATCRYITALYYDPDNPLFRVLFRPELAGTALVAALVHDVGQTSFGHELEEVDDEFSHGAAGARVLIDASVRDRAGRPLGDIITGSEYDEWGARLDDVLNLLGYLRPQRDLLPVEAVYRDILDGQVDADKFDYLLRDSVEARVPYGHGIDQDRFLRSLTTASAGDGDEAVLRLAIKQKGAAAAEAFAFARYELFQALYWHHTFRAVKAMLFTGVAATLADLRAKHAAELMNQKPFFEAYLARVLQVAPVGGVTEVAKGKSRSGELTIADRIAELMRAEPPPESRALVARDPTLEFLWKLCQQDGRSGAIVTDLIERSYYKRVLEIPLDALTEETRTSLRTSMGGANRVALLASVEKALLELLYKRIQDETATSQSLAASEPLQRLSETISYRFPFVLDLPTRGWLAAGEEPLFVRDFRRRYFRKTAGKIHGNANRTLWGEQLANMMRRIAYFRIYAEPTVHALMMRLVDENDIRRALKTSVTELAAIPDT